MKLKIEISGNEIEMTLEEAEKLHTELSRIFPKPLPVYPAPVSVPQFIPDPLWPIITCKTTQ
jgi:hypothetical protein